MPRNIQQAWSGPTVFAVDPPSAVVDGTLDVSGTPGIETLVAGGVLAGGTISPPGGTISLAIGAGLSNPAPGTIANSGVLVIAQGTVTATGTVEAGSGLTLTGGTLTAAGGVSLLVAGAGLTTSITSTNGTITGTGTLTALETAVAQTGTAYAFAAADRANLITFSNTAAIAATIAQAGTATFPAGWFVDVQNIGAGLLTITPTTSTIRGGSAMQLMTGFGARIVSDGTNYLAQNSAAFYALPSSAVSNWLPSIPTAALGGNARGANALDIQAVRNSATQVAGGTNAVAVGSYAVASGGNGVAVGTNVVASGTNSLASGTGGVTASGTASIALGNAGSATGTNSTSLNGAVVTGPRGIGIGTGINNFGTDSIAQGASLTVAGNISIVHGLLGEDRGNTGARIWSPRSLNSTTSKGHSQVEEYLFMINTAGSSAVRLTTDAAAAGAANVGNLGTNQAALVTVDIVITDFTTFKTATFYLAQSLLEKGANNAATTFTANGGGVVAGPASAGVFTLGANPTVTADTTNGGLNISYTPPGGNTDTFYAEALVRYVSLRNN